MEKNEDIKLIEWVMDDILGMVRRISLVSEPAIESDFMLFKSVDLKFKTIDEEKRVVTGPAMRPDIKIPRTENGEVYYGFFSRETVEQAAQLFFKKGSNSNNTNLEHEVEVDGVYVFESWIVKDPEMDKAKALGFTDVKEGDWWVSMKIENDTIWNNYLKTGLINGFSVEIRVQDKEVELISQIKDILSNDTNVDEQWDRLLEVLNNGQK